MKIKESSTMFTQTKLLVSKITEMKKVEMFESTVQMELQARNGL